MFTASIFVDYVDKSNPKTNYSDIIIFYLRKDIIL